MFGPRLERGGSLLVPSWTAKGERPLQDIHRLLDRVAKRAGLGAGELRSKAFRHTYCAARLQTLDRGGTIRGLLDVVAGIGERAAETLAVLEEAAAKGR